MMYMDMGSYACGVVSSYKKNTPDKERMNKLINITEAMVRNKNMGLFEPQGSEKVMDSEQFELLSDEAQEEVMQTKITETAEQIKTDVKTEVLNELSRQTMFPDREHVENIMRDVFDDVIYRRGYKMSK